VQSILENNNRDFWDEIRKLRHSNKELSNVVDLASTDDEIAHVFEDKYRDLLQAYHVMLLN
jgi:hypothetical protein